MSCERRAAGFRPQASGTATTNSNDNGRRRAAPVACSLQPVARRSARFPGFSLVEIMTVIVIIGLLAGAVSLGVRAYLSKAKVNVARKDIATIVNALESWQAEYGKFPSTSEGLAVLTVASEKWPEPILTKLPKDPWGNAYEYKCPGSDNQPYEVICYGADGRQGGSGSDADLSSVDTKE